MSFTLLNEQQIPEINSLVRLYTHDQTGARLLTVSNDDENKVFSINFRTPPEDSTGIAHIMEHSVLGGSRKYKVKEPFVELLKGSMKTFVNAMTFPDKTMYPVASTNLKDFYNLVDVYLDAVLYPLIPEHTLQQEGWHYEIENPDAPLTYKGVVFNEMKAVYSSPDSRLGELVQHSLFPDNTYRHDSGGDPLAIPDLTYAQFKNFHDTYYHPSNSYTYFYGDDPEAERLRIMDEWFKDFSQKDVSADVPLQAPFSAPRKLDFPYDSGDNPDAKSFVTITWMTPETNHDQTTLALSILSHILVGTSASPLRKTLIDSGLGEDLAGEGFSEYLRQGYFGAGMKGVQAENVEKVEALILETLAKLASDGIDPDTIAASLNTFEFHLRERNTGGFPRGLALLFGAIFTWTHGGDPVSALAFEKPLAAVKTAYATDKRYFEGLITRHLLENSHRITVTLNPDPQEGKRREAAETTRLVAEKAKLSPSDLEEVMAQAEELKRIQSTPDSVEALASIPRLTLADLEKQIKTVPNEISEIAGLKTYYHPLFTNNILYFDLGFDLHAIPADLLPYAGMFGSLMLQMGTQTQDFVKLIQRIGRDTGGIRSASFTSAVRGSDSSALYLFLRGKAVAPQSAALLDILKDILLTAKLDNRERFKQIVLEAKAGMESSLVPGGVGYVRSRLSARLSQSGWVSEQMGGISHLFFLRELAETIEKDWPSVLEKLETLRHLLINRQTMIANITVDESNWKNLAPQLATFFEALPSLAVDAPKWLPATFDKNEGLSVPAQINFVSKGVNLFKNGYKLHGSAFVIENYLRTTYLWEKVRVTGGAYGGASSLDPAAGTLAFLSWRDPNLLGTLNVYDGTADFLKALEIDEAELTKSIIGTISSIDSYQLPDAKGWTALSRSLTNYTDEMRQKIRDEVLGTTQADFWAYGKALEAVAAKGEVVVLGSPDALEKANKERAGYLQVTKVL